MWGLKVKYNMFMGLQYQKKEENENTEGTETGLKKKCVLEFDYPMTIFIELQIKIQPF